MNPLRMWSITDAKGRLFLHIIRRTRAEAIREFCDNGDEDEGGAPPDDWREWRKRGYSAARVTISKEPTP